ncbi:phosphoribosylaminoimidazolesuccinocarboxamide synthase [Haloglomus litoreum]|uniref:phosphoribosylaminoimidazolesuccinocarboxamide synthase n=1 Tax=Haloglomus litoreum TaxID=3034026 RepID=UPI0023E8269D|nr:phosphoribosylaminoimidazolesuccinocarboxamide synthase [Haloglomus sp. DT116]
MTSVKEFVIEEAATPDAVGRGRFAFTDDYSVFDWGKMPDPIPGKGASLCAMGAANFELLEAEGVPTHYRGVVSGASKTPRANGEAVSSDGEVVALDEAADPPREMAIDLSRVPDLPHEGRTYDYDAFHAEAGENYVVPLEIVFRNTVPVGSSLRGRADPADFGLDIDDWPEEAVDLPEAVVEFSTKFEESDRYLSQDEADRIAGAADIEELEETARTVNRLVTERAADAGLKHEDGKIECIYVDGEVRVADVVGTFDENRFSYDGQQVSKEVVRQYHRREQPEWVAAVDEAKARAKAEDVADWRDLCERDPEPLPENVVQAMSDLYCGGANAYLGRDLFDAPSLAEAVERVRDL